MRKLSLLAAALACTLLSVAQQPQFRGPARDGKFNETGLLKSWPSGGPECILTVSGLGKGYSTPVLANGIIYITGMTGTSDQLTALNPDGTVRWQSAYGNSWDQSFPDTRSTPTVDGNRVYVISGTGRLACFDTETGRELWAAEADKENGSRWHDWGVAESVLVTGKLAIVTPSGNGASVAAYDKITGKPAWKSTPVEGKRSYASAVLVDNGSLSCVLASTTREIIALSPETGETLWTFTHWLAERDPNEDLGQIFTNMPVVSGRDIFLSRGYNYPSLMITVSEDGKSATEKWTGQTLDNHHHGVIVHEGYLYGSNWINNGNGNWVCLDAGTGKVMWEEKWFNKGPAVFADGLLYLMDEKGGNVGLVRPDPAKFDLVSTFKISEGTGPFWAHPFIADGKLLIRHGDVLKVYDLKPKQ